MRNVNSTAPRDSLLVTKEKLINNLLEMNVSEADLDIPFKEIINGAKLQLKIDWETKNQLQDSEDRLKDIHLMFITRPQLIELLRRKTLGTFIEDVYGNVHFKDQQGNDVPTRYIIPSLLHHGVLRSDLTYQTIDLIEHAKYQINQLRVKLRLRSDKVSPLNVQDLLFLPSDFLRDLYALKGLGCRDENWAITRQMKTFNGDRLETAKTAADHLLWSGFSVKDLSVYLDDIFIRL